MVGTLAVLGGYWLVVRSLVALEVYGEWVPYAGHVSGAALAGAMMAAHAPLRPWREPLIAGVVAIGVMAIVYLSLPAATFGWVAARSETPWLLALGLAALSALGATAGAAIMRHIATTRPKLASLLVISALVITGTAVTLTQFAVGLGISFDRTGTLVALIGVLLGGFLTQLMVTVYRPWATGGGSALFTLVLVTDSDSASDVISMFIGVVLLVLIGVLGARLARRWAARPASTVLPSARLH